MTALSGGRYFWKLWRFLRQTNTFTVKAPRQIVYKVANHKWNFMKSWIFALNHLISKFVEIPIPLQYILDIKVMGGKKN